MGLKDPAVRDLHSIVVYCTAHVGSQKEVGLTEALPIVAPRISPIALGKHYGVIIKMSHNAPNVTRGCLRLMVCMEGTQAGSKLQLCRFHAVIRDLARSNTAYLNRRSTLRRLL